MTESAFTSKLLKALRAHPALRDAVIWKLNDRTTKGIPDVCIVLRGVTTWFELKVWPNRPTKIQWHYLEKLQRSYVVTRLRSGSIAIDQGKLFGADFDVAVETIVSLL